MLNEMAECSQTYDQVKEELEGIERRLAPRLGVPVRECRLKLLALSRANELEEDALVADWYEAYQSYLNCTNDPRFGQRPPPRPQPPPAKDDRNECQRGRDSGLAAFVRPFFALCLYIPPRWRCIVFRRGFPCSR